MCHLHIKEYVCASKAYCTLNNAFKILNTNVIDKNMYSVVKIIAK